MFRKIRQLFCWHNHTNWCRKVSKDGVILFNLSGETHYLVCEDCGKVLKERFVPNADGS